MHSYAINPLMMGAVHRQTYHEHGEKLVQDEMMHERKMQVQDSSYWSPTPTRALPNTITERSSLLALRALLQQPPALSLVPDACLELDTSLNGAVEPSWPPYPDQAGFKTPNSLPFSGTTPLPQHYDILQSSEHQVRHQGFDFQQPTSNHYHASYFNGSEVGQTLPFVGNCFPTKQEQSGLEVLHQERAWQTERITSPDFAGGFQRTGSSLPKELQKTPEMMGFAQKQMRKQMKNLLERRSFDKKRHISPPKREGAGGNKLKFGITADGIQNGPDSHPMLQSHQQQPQQLLFSKEFLQSANQVHHLDTDTVTNRGSTGSTFSTKTKIQVEDAEAMVIKQFQEKVFQLDIGTRLGFQESLYRLARSARRRQENIKASSHTSADPDFAAMMNVGLGSCDIPDSRPQSGVHIETPTNPIDRNLVNMLFFPLRVPGIQNPPDPPPSSNSIAVSPGSSQGNWDWSTPAASKPKIRKGSGGILQTQSHGRGGAALEVFTCRTPAHLAWTDSPQLTDYASPTGSSSLADPSMLNHRHAGVNLKYRGTVAHSPRQLGANHTSTMEPVDIRARRRDSQSSVARDLSDSPRHAGQVLNFNNVEFHGPSSYSSQETNSFVNDGQHVVLADISHGLEQDHTIQHFAMTDMHDDILGAALSIQNRAEVDQINQFYPPPSPSGHNSIAKNDTVGFSSSFYEEGSHFGIESLERNLGTDSTTTGMSIFDQRSAAVSRNMVNTVPYTRFLS